MKGAEDANVARVAVLKETEDVKGVGAQTWYVAAALNAKRVSANGAEGANMPRCCVPPTPCSPAAAA